MTEFDAESVPAGSAPAGGSEAVKQTFARQLDRVHLCAMRAVVKTSRPSTDALARITADLVALERELAKLREEHAASLRDQWLLRQLHLRPDDLDFLWAAVALTIDPRLAAHTQVLVGSEARTGLSVALYSLLLELPKERSSLLALSLHPLHPLLRHHLLVPQSGGALPANMTYAASLRIATFLAGDDGIDPLLATCGGALSVSSACYFDERQHKTLTLMRQALGAREPSVLLLDGCTESGRGTAVAMAAGRKVFALSLRRVTAVGQEAALAALRRECLLSSGLALVEEVDALSSSEEPTRLRTLCHWLDETQGPVALTTRDRGMELSCQRTVVRLSWPMPDVVTRSALWRACLPPELRSQANGDELAQRYHLSGSGIKKAITAATLLRASQAGSSLTLSDVVAGIFASMAERLSGLADHVVIRQTWNDLVLPADTLAQIRELVARVRCAHQVYEQWGFRSKAARGTGVAALFSGLPGTGKTMVAGLIAQELGLELYQVDLSKVISKWVGETEKQLARLFEAAEVGHTLLLFDEADSLFSRRTDVKGANDRYANLEVNYLLQRVESFGGTVILTTNHGAGIDTAFLRRLSAHVKFWPPDEDERARLWRSMLSKSAPIQRPLHIASLVQKFPEMSGANIRNAVLAAAFRAAAEHSSICQRHLEEAARAEYVAMGRV